MLRAPGDGTVVLFVLRSSARGSVLATMVGNALVVTVPAMPVVVFSTVPLPRVPVGAPICLDVACAVRGSSRVLPVSGSGSPLVGDALTSIATAPSLVVPVPAPCVAGSHCIED